MLSFIADLDDRRLATVAKARHTLSVALLYEEILGSWLAFEERRVRDVPGSPAGLRAGELWQAVTALALRLWESGEAYLRPAELAEVAGTLTGLADGQLSGEQTAHAVGAGSLMVRTEEGLFGFIHSSVMEWLVARYIASAFADPTCRAPCSATRGWSGPGWTTPGSPEPTCAAPISPGPGCPGRICGTCHRPAVPGVPRPPGADLHGGVRRGR